MMPLWFVVVCAVMGAVLAYWLVREVYRDRRHQQRLDALTQRSIDRERKIFEAIARGRR